MEILTGYAAFVAGIRVALLVGGAIVIVLCALDWAARARRINPFSGPARFARNRIDPLIAPVERLVVRMGGVPSAAPWWAIVAYAVGGILLIALLGLLGGIVAQVVAAIETPSAIPILIASWIFAVLKLALIVRVVASWLPVSPRAWWIRWSFALTEWMLSPLRRVVPTVGMIDITPLVAWLLLVLLQGALRIP